MMDSRTTTRHHLEPTAENCKARDKEYDDILLT
jgi:hypothetical protein